MDSNKRELAEDDGGFRDLLVRRGKAAEIRHLEKLGLYEQPKYHIGDFNTGFKETIRLINSMAPVIYQPIIIDTNNRILAKPDFLVFDALSGFYKIRDVKLAANLDKHPEIALQLGLYSIVFNNVFGITPIVEVVTGAGLLVEFDPAPASEVFNTIDKIKILREQPVEPFEHVGWSKCNQCEFRKICWDSAIKQEDIATVPYLDLGACKELASLGISKYTDLHKFKEHVLATLDRPWGKGTQRVGSSKAKKIKLQVEAMLFKKTVIESWPELYPGYLPGQRPIVIFDIEDDALDIDLGTKVYLWGLMVVTDEGPLSPELVVAPRGVEGDKHGWFAFLASASKIFKMYDNVPLIHYTHHEPTWIKKYIERYGDKKGIASKVIENLWDMHPQIYKNLFLPVPSYSLKHIEKLAGFKRSQDEYGGLWSITTYDRYINSQNEEEANAVLSGILTYNSEDLLATLKVYEWLESKIIKRDIC